MYKNQSRFVQILLTATIMVILLGAFGFFVGKILKIKNYQSVPVSTLPTVTPQKEKLTTDAGKLPFSLVYPEKYEKSATSDVINNPNYLLSIESWKYFPNTVLRTWNIFQVLTVPDSKTSADCYKRSYYNTALTQNKTINGEEFYYSQPFGGAAAGTHDTNEEYKVFHNTCYQINLIHFESSDWNNPQDIDLAQKDKEESFNELHQILSSFRFLDSKAGTTFSRQPVDDQIKMCKGFTNGSVINESDTGRKFFGLPKAIYPKENLKFTFFGATAGEVSNFEDPDYNQDMCWETGYEFDLTKSGQNGYLELFVTSKDKKYPDYKIRVNVWKYGENPEQGW